MYKIVAATTVALVLSACSQQTIGDFAYTCMPGGGMFDGRSCTSQLTNRYSLRSGEGSGLNVELTFEHGDGSGARLIQTLGDEDLVRKIGLDDRLLVAQTRDGKYFVAPAQTDEWPMVIGPLSAEEFAAKYPNAPQWKLVQ